MPGDATGCGRDSRARNLAILIYRAGRDVACARVRGWGASGHLGVAAVTREAIELGFILKQIRGYEFSMDDFDGRLSLQKTIYLLQAFGVNLGYSFSWRLRGPYCSLLTTNGFTLDRVYHLLPDHDTKFKNDRAHKQFAKFQRFIEGKGLESLEILALIHYLKECLGLDDETTVRKILDKKRTNFDEGQIRRELEYIRKEGLVQ